jgi:perosamine synthetase
MRLVNLYFSNISVRDALGLCIAAIWEPIRFFRKFNFRHKHAFEQKAHVKIKTPFAISVPTNRSGIFALLTALDIGEGDEAIVTGYTCAAVPEPILQCGVTPVYVDIEPGHFCLNPKKLTEAITSRTRVIILQHTYGFAGAIEEVIDIARRHKLFVIEDCALAFGSKKDGQWLGTFGDAAVWSFELSKTLSVGWGGLVGINHDNDLADRVRVITEGAGFQGRWLAAQRLLQAGISGLLYHHRAPYVFRHYGVGALFKFGIFRSSADTPASDLRLPSDLQWKFLLRQLKRLDTILANSKDTQLAYEAVLSAHGCISESVRMGTAESHLIRFPILVQDAQRFVGFFAAKDIEAGRWFSSPVSSGGESPTRYGYVPESCPVAERVCANIVNLPVHGRLTQKLVALVASTLDDYLLAFPEEVEFIQSNSTFKPLESNFF